MEFITGLPLTCHTQDTTGVVVFLDDSDKPLSIHHNMSSVKICRILKTFIELCEVYLEFILKIHNSIQYSKTFSHMYKTI